MKNWISLVPVRAALLSGVIGGFTASPLSAIELNGEVDGRLGCPELGNTYECAQQIEKALLAASPGLAVRQDGILNVKLVNGSYYQIKDKDAVYNLMELHSGDRFLAIREQFYEGHTWHLLDRLNGTMSEIGGYPLFSPDGSKFIAVETDLIAQYSDTVFAVYAVMPKGVAEVFDGRTACSTWGAEHVRWQDQHSAAFAVATVETVNSDTAAMPAATLSDRDGAWTITPPIDLGCR